MKEFLKDPAACADSTNEIVSDLVRGWGNPGWAASTEYLSACVEHALQTPGFILECGSGLTSVVVGAIACAQQKEHWILEHDSAWARKVQKTLRRYGLKSVELRCVGLQDYGDFAWYSAPLNEMPGSFSLVICDGPPGVTKGGRYGLAPVMTSRLAPGCVILLDDAVREEERLISKRWERDLHGLSTIHGSMAPYIKFIIEEAMHNPPM